MAAAETTYLVTTKYRVDYGDRSPVRRHEADLTGLEKRAASTARGLGRVGTAAVGLGVSLIGVSTLGLAAFGAIAKSVLNVSGAMNSALGMASQINLAFQFDANPAANFEQSLVASRDLMGEIYSDAARLPGEAQDFVNIARSVSGGVFAAGGDLERLRQFTARVALAAPAAGQSAGDAANQAMRALFGTAGVGDNPLFAMLYGSKLLPNAETFNKAPAAERLNMLDAALSKLTDNEIFRSLIIDTLDTQFGTLMDNLFGMNSALGETAGQSGYQMLVDSLKWLNATLEENKQPIATALREIGGAFESLARTADELGAFTAIASGAESITSGLSTIADGILEFIAGINVAVDLIKRSPLGVLKAVVLDGHKSRNAEHFNNLFYQEAEIERWRMRGAPGGEIDAETAAQLEALGMPLARLPVPAKVAGAGGKASLTNPALGAAPKVVQYNTIRIDYKADDSPETFAVKVASAMERAERHPRRSRVMPAFTPRASGLA